jgi:hypothetical protein
MARLTVTCAGWRPLQRNTLLGFATVRIAEMRMTVADVAVHEKNGSRWAQLPSKPMISKGRDLVTDDNGKIKYAPIFSFDSKEVERAFSAAVVKAVEDAQFGADFS